MKLPASLGQKKTKAIEQMLEEVGVGKASICDDVSDVLQMCKCILHINSVKLWVNVYAIH